jgi:hypothetical protein
MLNSVLSNVSKSFIANKLDLNLGKNKCNEMYNK